MQTPGRLVQSQTPMFSPIGERMDKAYTSLIERTEEKAVGEQLGRTQVRQLGRIILEFERLNGSMRTMRSEIQQDLRDRRKYYKQETKILKEDLENTNLFKTAALFDGRKNLALLSGALALKEAGDGDLGGTLQATSAAVGLLLPEIISGIVGILGLNSIAGGGNRGAGVPRGGIGRGGMRGMGGKGGIITAAIIAASLLGSKLFGGGNADTRRQEGAQQTISGVNTINEPDVNRFKVQLNRFESILDGMMSGPTPIGQTKKGKTNAPSGALGPAGDQQLNEEVSEATQKDDWEGFGSGEAQAANSISPSSIIVPPSVETTESGTTNTTGSKTIVTPTEAEKNEIINNAGGKSNIMPSMFSDDTSSVSPLLSSNNASSGVSSVEPTSEAIPSSGQTSSPEVNILDSSKAEGSSGFVGGADPKTSPMGSIDLEGGSLDNDKKIMKGEGWMSKLDPRNWFKGNRKESEAVKSGMSNDDVNVVNNAAESGSQGEGKLPGPGDGQVQVNVNTRYRVNSGTAIDKFDHSSSIRNYTTYRAD